MSPSFPRLAKFRLLASLPVVALAVFASSQLQAQSVTYTGSSPALNFGSANVCPSGVGAPAPCSNTLTLTYDVSAGTTIGSVAILTTGAANLDFQAKAADTSATLCSAKTYGSATTCSVDVTFTPLAPGQAKGAVQIVGNSGSILATTFIYGTGIGPAITFQPGKGTSGVNPVVLSDFLTTLPFALAVDASDNLYVVDEKDSTVQEFMAAGGYTTIKTLGSGYKFPRGVAVDGAGNVFVADDEGIKEVMAVNGSISANPTINLLGGAFAFPAGVVVDAAGNVFTTGLTNPGTGEAQLYEILATGGYTTVKSLFTLSGTPSGLAVDANDNVYLVGGIQGGNVVEIFAASGYTTTQTLIPHFGPMGGVAVDAAGDVYFSNIELYEILAVNGRVPVKQPIYIAIPPYISGFNAGVVVDRKGNVFGANTHTNQLFATFLTDLPNFDAGTTKVGDTGSTESVRFQNVGNATLTGSGELSDTTNFSVVPGLPTLPNTVPDCTFTTLSLARGAICNLSVAFTPRTPGPLTSLLTLTDNALNGNLVEQTVPFSGTGKGNHAEQTITFPTIPPQTALASVDHLYATASSGLRVTFASRTPEVCTVSGTKATLLTSGSCDITASQGGNDEYFATITGQAFLVHHRRQVIHFDAIAAQPAGTMLPLTASSDSGLPITYASTTPVVCTVSGSTASLLTAGTCSIGASQAGDATWFPSGPKTVTFKVQ